MIDHKRTLIKKIIKFLLKFFHINIKPHIIFDPSRAFHFYHLLPIIEILVKDNRVNITIIKDDDFDESNFNLNNVKFISFDKLWHDWFGIYDVFITTDYERSPGWAGVLTTICMFHGAGPKISYIRDLRINDYDMIFTPGPSTGSVAENYVNDNVKIVPIGLPVLDKLCIPVQFDLPKSVSFDAKKPILLYAPSWSSNVSLVSMDDLILEALKNLDDYNIIIRPHPLLFKPELCGGIDWEKKLLSIESDQIKISYPMKHSAYDLMPFVDVLMGDMSSIVYEFLVINKPIIIYMKDEILGNYDADHFIEPLNHATSRLNSPTELNEILRNIEKISIEKHEGRKKLMDQTFYNVGTASKNAVENLYKICNLR